MAQRESLREKHPIPAQLMVVQNFVSALRECERKKTAKKFEFSQFARPEISTHAIHPYPRYDYSINVNSQGKNSNIKAEITFGLDEPGNTFVKLEREIKIENEIATAKAEALIQPNVAAQEMLWQQFPDLQSLYSSMRFASRVFDQAEETILFIVKEVKKGQFQWYITLQNPRVGENIADITPLSEDDITKIRRECKAIGCQLPFIQSFNGGIAATNSPTDAHPYAISGELPTLDQINKRKKRGKPIILTKFGDPSEPRYKSRT